jgi:hypothetical protein
MLQKFQGNQIFEAIQAARLDPGQFDLIDSESEFTLLALLRRLPAGCRLHYFPSVVACYRRMESNGASRDYARGVRLM